MTRTILLTRPQAASEKWAELLNACGYHCIIDPLLCIQDSGAGRPSGIFDGIIFTSANAVATLTQRGLINHDDLSLPCYCVGTATAEAAKSAGFAQILLGGSDSAELASLIAAKNTESKNFLHIAGDIVDDKLAIILNKVGFSITRWPIYRAIPTDGLSQSTIAAIAQKEIDAVLLFSPRSARLLIAALEQHGQTQACGYMDAIGLSQAVADVLQILPWRRICVATSPAEQDILNALDA